MKFILRVALYLICYAISMYGWMAIDFSKLIHKGRTLQTQVLLIVLSMSTAYLMAQLIMALMIRNVFY
ncbi:MAG: DUF1146 domain-containing protein [Erysipelotrichaceae bacterium]|nr:DUF1146 domain-containing protein [Erysipelotrichaceae bacterium]